MKLKTLHLKILAFAVAATSWSLAANAEMHLYWHWEGGGGGSCGPFCTDVVAAHIVIDGWHDDGTGSGDLAKRFPDAGVRGSKTNVTNNRQIDYPEFPGKGCTVPANISGVNGLAKGKKTWNIYIGSSVPTDIQNDVANLIDSVNIDQRDRKSGFQIKIVSWGIQADSYITTPGIFSKALAPSELLRANLTTDRSGTIKSSRVEVTPDAVPVDVAASIAYLALGRLAGLAIETEPSDSNYPSAMDPNVTLSPSILNPCMGAALNANFNQGTK
jgi:hypothetical protein